MVSDGQLPPEIWVAHKHTELSDTVLSENEILRHAVRDLVTNAKFKGAENVLSKHAEIIKKCEELK